MEGMGKWLAIGGLLSIVLLAGVIGGCAGVEQVDTGHRGVQIRFGEVDKEAGSLTEGLYFFNPLTTKIVEINVQVQKWDGTANTYTKDVQQADIKYVMNFHLNPNEAHTVYRDVGRQWENALVPQVVSGIMKQVIGTYDAVDLIEHRAKATAEIQSAIAEALATRNVIFDRIELVNIQYHKEFEKSVEDKVVAVQRAIEEKNKTVQVQEQAKQAVITAQAQAESMRIRANALASNPKLVEYEAVQKWDGKLPNYNFGSGALPFINLQGVGK